MKKLIVLTMFLLILPISAQAHSGLVSSDPANGETVEETITEVNIEFDLPIQQANMVMTSAGGEEIIFSDVQAFGQTLVGSLQDELSAGNYEIEWNVISEDGHKVEGTIGFEAAIPEPPIPEKSVEVETEPEEPIEEETEPAEVGSPETEVAAQQMDNGGFSMMTGSILVVLLLAVILFGIMVRRK